MLTSRENERLTRVGPGTPAGELLRRYWQVLCPTKALHEGRDRKRVRILGEDVVVVRDTDGAYVCIQERCPHRGASLYFGFLEPDGIRCCYHGWKFDCTTGACIERPFESARPPDGLRLRAYPVEQLGGLLFVYMGPPETKPLLPRWDVLARDDRPRQIVVLPAHRCNWLQIQENTADTTHLYWLHGHRMKQLNGGVANQVSEYFCRPIVSYDWRACDWGIEKAMDYGGDRPEHATWPPFIFPNILRTPEGPVEAMHFRIPIDDEHTRVVWVGLMPTGAGEIVPDEATPYSEEFDPPNFAIEHVSLETFYGQDRVVWETQGVIADRSLENLGASDRGIVLFRRMLAEQIDRVERGEAPTVAVVRDPAQNECIRFDASEHTYDLVNTP